MKPTFSPQDEAWMARALTLAERAEGEGEVPVGAVLVRDENQEVRLGGHHAHSLAIFLARISSAHFA